MIISFLFHSKLGGCAMWYNEPEYWAAIQRRLELTVPVLNENYLLPNTEAGVVYGQKKKGGEVKNKQTNINRT